ncbi:flagella cluster protein [Halobium palmae]|uniref:Flagella cluster protein n=1 Tax=Halobium palmae TaxID=1776492 RepID=A0ABD5S3G1_9EURY
MEQLDADGGFDVHEYRHGLKLLKQDRGTMHLANRKGYACPACGEAFDRLFVSERQHNTFNAPTGAFCLTRTPDEILLLTH